MRRARRGVLSLAVVALATASLAGCGNKDSAKPSTASTNPGAVCTQALHVKALSTSADLDGDGKADQLTFYPPVGSCQAYLAAAIGDAELTAPLVGPLADLPVRARDLTLINLPGHTGNVVLLRQHHPRGGFSATLFGYAQGSFAALTAAGGPLFGFVATDTLTTPYSAHCVAGGFDVVRGTLVRRTWTIERTSYAVNGDSVTAGVTAVVAHDLSDLQFQRRYADLARYKLFTGCTVR